MKKIIILIVLLISFNSFSQDFFKNRIALDYALTFNYSENFDVRIYSLKNHIKSSFDNDFNIAIRTSRKTSLELLTGFKKYKLESYRFNFNEITYGLGLNYYYGKNYSPIGNSFGFFYKVSNYIVDDYNAFYAYLQRIEKDSYETNTVINHKVTVFGFKLNFVTMLSDRIPLFLKYGGTLSIPISAEIFDASYKKGSFSEYGNGLYSDNFLDYFVNKERYKLYVGVGYMF